MPHTLLEKPFGKIIDQAIPLESLETTNWVFVWKKYFGYQLFIVAELRQFFLTNHLILDKGHSESTSPIVVRTDIKWSNESF